MAHKVLTTIHGRLDIKDLEGAYSRWSHYPLVSISQHQRKPLPNANWIDTVYHGLPQSSLTFHSRPGDYLAFLGRISPEKRPDRAIRIAHAAVHNAIHHDHAAHLEVSHRMNEVPERGGSR